MPRAVVRPCAPDASGRCPAPEQTPHGLRAGRGAARPTLHVEPRPIAFAAPWLLLALPALPVLWWLLRVTPPAPRRIAFPALRLLRDLPIAQETPARTPWWLLLLRMVAAALLILGLAQPVLGPGGGAAGEGPLLLVVDDGWAAAADWPARMAAAGGALDRAGREGRRAALLATAPTETAEPPRVLGPMPAEDLRARLAALRPKPWAPDRAAALAAFQAWRTANPGAIAHACWSATGWSTPREAGAARCRLRWPPPAR